jgi:hypothetical protein
MNDFNTFCRILRPFCTRRRELLGFGTTDSISPVLAAILPSLLASRTSLLAGYIRTHESLSPQDQIKNGGSKSPRVKGFVPYGNAC